jgi:hypothetical protein
MPRRKRQSKRVGAALTLGRYLDLTLGPHPTRGEDDRTLALVWAHHRERLLEDQPPPWGFWRFEPEVPEALREERPVLRPVDDGQSAKHQDQGHEAVHREREALEARRSAWLAERELQEIIENIGA